MTGLKSKQEDRYKDSRKHDLKLTVYKDGVDKALKSTKDMPAWFGEATILQLVNGLERMKVSIDNGDTVGADKILGESQKLYEQVTLIPMGYAWQGKEIAKVPAEKRLETAIDFGKEYVDRRRNLDFARSAGNQVNDLERSLAQAA